MVSVCGKLGKVLPQERRESHFLWKEPSSCAVDFALRSVCRAPEEWRLKTNERVVGVEIGADYESALLVDVRTGAVYSEDEDGALLFVNSSLEKLLQCIESVRKEIDFDEKSVDEKKRLAAMKAIRKEFQAIDREARRDDGWWSFVLEQLEDGIL